MATVELTLDNFEQTINDNDTVIVDFWAEWCGPCRSFAPTFEQASETNEDIVFGKVDSPYFKNNPGAADKLPRIARTIRTLSTDECGRMIAQLAEHPRRELWYPFVLRFYGWNYRVAPPLVRWLLRLTGAKRG